MTSNPRNTHNLVTLTGAPSWSANLDKNRSTLDCTRGSYTSKARHDQSNQRRARVDESKRVWSRGGDAHSPLKPRPRSQAFFRRLWAMGSRVPTMEDFAGSGEGLS